MTLYKIYKCIFTFSHKSDSITVETPEISVDISKQKIDVPNIPSVFYNGEVRYPELYSLSLYEVERVSGVNAGAYPVKITLSDPENYRFSTSEDGEIIVDFIIKKADNRWLESPRVNNVYSWQTHSPVGTALFGNTEYLFSSAQDGDYTAAAPKAVGTYYMKAYVKETENYSGLVSEPISFSVLSNAIISAQIL